MPNASLLGLAALKSNDLACAITPTALVGHWVKLGESSEGFEEAHFLKPAVQQGFVSFMRRA